MDILISLIYIEIHDKYGPLVSSEQIYPRLPPPLVINYLYIPVLTYNPLARSLRFAEDACRPSTASDISSYVIVKCCVYKITVKNSTM